MFSEGRIPFLDRLHRSDLPFEEILLDPADPNAEHVYSGLAYVTKDAAIYGRPTYSTQSFVNVAGAWAHPS